MSSPDQNQELITEVQEGDAPQAAPATAPTWTTIVGKKKRNAPLSAPSSSGSAAAPAPAAVPIVKRKRKPGTNGNVTGTAVGTKITSVGPKLKFANIFATRFDTEVTAEDLKAHLVEKLSVNVTVEAVKTKYDGYRSFHITSRCEDPSIFMKDHVWPQNIYVRWWRRERDPSSAQSGDSTVPKSVH